MVNFDKSWILDGYIWEHGYKLSTMNHKTSISTPFFNPSESNNHKNHNFKPNFLILSNQLINVQKEVINHFSTQNPNSTNQNLLISQTITYKGRNFTLKPINYTNKNQIQLTIKQNYTKFTSNKRNKHKNSRFSTRRRTKRLLKRWAH